MRWAHSLTKSRGSLGESKGEGIFADGQNLKSIMDDRGHDGGGDRGEDFQETNSVCTGEKVCYSEKRTFHTGGGVDCEIICVKNIVCGKKLPSRR